jgi:hypothetical protein
MEAAAVEPPRQIRPFDRCRLLQVGPVLQQDNNRQSRSHWPRAAILATIIASGVRLSGCETTVSSHPDYAVTSGGELALTGEGDLVMDAGLRDQVITASPRSAAGCRHLDQPAHRPDH